jgi:hypothetical protein
VLFDGEVRERLTNGRTGGHDQNQKSCMFHRAIRNLPTLVVFYPASLAGKKKASGLRFCRKSSKLQSA